jgi:hypothetical protein
MLYFSNFVFFSIPTPAKKQPIFEKIFVIDFFDYLLNHFTTDYLIDYLAF